MTTFRLYMLLSAALLTAAALSAQSPKLNTGDKLPSLALENTINYHSSSLNLSDFRGKYIILDFWNHNCVPCFAAFPKLDSLQQQFEDKLQIILVNRETKEATHKFFSQRRKIKMPCLPMITGDEELHNLFPSEGYPYHVWIDTAGIIRQVSGGYNTTEEHIRDFIAGREMALKNPTQKKIMIENIFSEQRLKSLVSSSTLSLCSDSWDPGGANREPLRNGSLLRLSRNCSSVLELFRSAFAENGKYNFYADYGLDFAVDDPYPYIIPDDKNKFDDWLQHHAFSYELIVPAGKSADMFRIMQDDLQRHFDLRAEVRYTKVRSAVLRRLSLLSANGPEKENGNEIFQYQSGIAGGTFCFLNYPVDKLVDQIMVWLSYDYPFFNELNETGKLDLSVRERSIEPLNIDFLREDLSRYGLSLVIEEREIPVLFIRKK